MGLKTIEENRTLSSEHILSSIDEADFNNGDRHIIVPTRELQGGENSFDEYDNDGNGNGEGKTFGFGGGNDSSPDQNRNGNKEGSWFNDISS
jgi:hypothetical protein